MHVNCSDEQNVYAKKRSVSIANNAKYIKKTFTDLYDASKLCCGCD